MAVRIYSLAKDIGLDSKELVDLCTRLGILNKGSALASLDDDELTKIKKHLAEKSAPAAAAPATPTPTREPIKEVPIRDPGARFGAAKRDLAATAKRSPPQTKRDDSQPEDSSQSDEVEWVVEPVSEPVVDEEPSEGIE
ncbi:MAG: translation initiation factor IF-2 N-terminal domain-containing protein, partial [Pirellula sp.]